ncbi:MAG: restriction endonuclease subunit S [Methanomicrobia archaeon]|nr:restriction endonuclease subunit S [Methanomicrobia archaeon]
MSEIGEAGMGEWKECKLGDVSEIVGGGTPKTKVPEYWNGEIPWLTPRDLSNFSGRYISKGERNISKLGLANSSAKILPKGAILLSSRAPVGYLAIALDEMSTNQGFRSLIPNSKTNSLFLFYLLKNNVDYLKSQSTGTTFGELAGSTLKSLSFLFPPLPEQRAIASVLSSLDDKIDLLHRQNKTLEAMAETLFRQWFVEEAEEGWEWVELGQFIEVMRGLSYKGAGLAEKGNGVPMHNLNSVYEGGGYKHKGIKYYSGDYKERHLVKPGDVIITNTEQGHDLLLIGYPAIVPKYFGDFGIFSQHIYRLRLKDKRITEPFLYYLLMSYDVREQLAGATNGSTVNMLSKDGIEWAKFKTPPDEKIKEFTSIVKPLLGKKESNYSQIRALEKLRDTLLPKLMSGEVRVEMESNYGE